MNKHHDFDKWPRVRLSQSDTDYCEQLGRDAQDYHDQRGTPGTGGAPFTGPLSLALNTRGILGECALWMFYRPLGLAWNQSKIPRDDGPDIGDHIDAKERSHDHDDLIFNIQQKIRPHWIYQMVFGSGHPTYVIGPWVYGSEVIGREYELRGTSDPARAAIFIDQLDKVLRPPHTHYQDLKRARATESYDENA